MLSPLLNLIFFTALLMISLISLCANLYELWQLHKLSKLPPEELLSRFDETNNVFRPVGHFVNRAQTPDSLDIKEH